MYKLELNKPKEDYFEIKITADANDGDYLSEKSILTKYQFDLSYQVLKFFVDNYGGEDQFENWAFDNVKLLEEILSETNIKLTEEIKDALDLIYVPYDHSFGDFCHTLDQIEIKYFTTDGKCYNVTL